MSDPDVRQLRYFVAVAEERHFGRAAERLGIAQPPLSRSIRDLERQLGVRLLERTTRQVRVTPAGEEFLRDARAALNAVDAAVRRARNAGSARPVLRVAIKADFDAGLLPMILEEYKSEPDGLSVDLLFGGRGDQVPALRDGRADVAILPLPYDAAGIDRESLLTEPRLLAISATDPLAARRRVRLADLAGHVLPDGSPAEAGETPPPPPDHHRSGHRLDLAQIFHLVEIGETVFFPPVSVVQRHTRPGIAYREVDDLDPSTLTVAWPETSRSPAVAAFVRVAGRVAAEHPSDGAWPDLPAATGLTL
ncbi:LysR family transcriptional regulator [Microlunatus sp. Gsoil 973]|uniref:LysR family transcriptional regulator n=1 Tax=Microlunatus sp. Gsoil 973 TaxID=2672569 RepID=UPI0012B47EE5|nr:LysR family transcriptional regulator [Microlunatus sp. Gsoil 973]QGN34166.1 LysR family transcriptional regulator [Microlunatus sp. Gsoil 973]